MIDVKDAVRIAKDKIAEFYPQEELIDLLLEEVEISEDNKYWFITLGFYIPKPKFNTNTILELSKAIAGEPYIYKYKVFKIDAETGKVFYMKRDKDIK